MTQSLPLHDLFAIQKRSCAQPPNAHGSNAERARAHEYARKIPKQPADLSRRSFSSDPPPQVSRSAIRLFRVCSAPTRLAAAGNFDPRLYSIAPDGCHGHMRKPIWPAHCLDHGADCSEELAPTERHAVQLASNDPKFNDPCSARRLRRQLEHHDELRCDEPRRAAGRSIDRTAPAHGCPRDCRQDSVISHPKSKKSMTFADIVKAASHQTFTPDELNDQAQDARPIYQDRVSVPHSYSVEDQRTAKYASTHAAAWYANRDPPCAMPTVKSSTTALRRSGFIKPLPSTTRPNDDAWCACQHLCECQKRPPPSVTYDVTQRQNCRANRCSTSQRPQTRRSGLFSSRRRYCSGSRTAAK